MNDDHENSRCIECNPSGNGRTSRDHHPRLRIHTVAHIELHASVTSMSPTRAEQPEHACQRSIRYRLDALLQRQDINIRPTLHRAPQPCELIFVPIPCRRALGTVLPRYVPGHYVDWLHAHCLHFAHGARAQVPLVARAHLSRRRWRRKELQNFLEKLPRDTAAPLLHVANRSAHCVSDATTISCFAQVLEAGRQPVT